jgi:capsular exopolysaccharide synthesis family protein
LDGFNTALRTVDAAENYLQLPVLSAFPRLKFDHRDYRKQLVAANGNGRPADLELFRTLRASLSMLDKEERRSFLFTSSFANEGKTFAACNFAASLAQQGLRTVVLDLDLRKPHVEKFFTGQMDRTPGVTDILQNHKKLTEVAQAQPGMDNLSWVAAGGATSENLELLSPELFRKLLEQALQKYDRVVIDTPPIHPVKDALLMAKEVSAVITLVDGSKTARRAVAKTIQWLRNANAPVAGVVLNRLSRSRNGQGFYYHDFCGYGYGAYGHPGREKIENREVENMK